jgi:predicted Zn-dependent protease
MILKKNLEKIQKAILKQIKADDYQLFVTRTDNQFTRFAENSITQHISGDLITARLKFVKDQRIGDINTSLLDDKDLIDAVKKAEEIALNNSPSPDIATSLALQPYPEIRNYYPAIEKLDTKTMIDIVRRCIDNAKSKGAKLSGIVTKSINEEVFSTKNGFCGRDKSSEIELSMTMRRDHIETKVAFSHKDMERLPLPSLISQINSQFDALATMKTMHQEVLPVILRPQAVKSLMMYLYWLFDRKAADQGLSAFSDQMGKQFFGQKFSLSSTIDDADLTIPPYSTTCVHKNIDWVKNGVIYDLTTSRDWAQKNNLTPSTLYNIIIDGDAVSESQMMSHVKRGLIINDLWYIRLNDMKSFDLTGMTRDGVLYFENGEVKHAVNNFRFNEKLHEVTQKIIATGEKVMTSSTSKVPTMLVDNFNFVDKTTF